MPIGFLIREMDEHLKDSTSEAYSYRHMKRKLSEHFSDNVIFTDDNRGRSNETVVTLKTASKLLSEFYNERQRKNSEDEKSD